MSALNGDRARFRKNRKRKLLHRQRIWALMARLRDKADGNGAPAAERMVVAPKARALTRKASLTPTGSSSTAS